TSERRVLEQSLRRAEQRAAQAAEAAERQLLQTEARSLAAQIVQHDVPEPPRFFTDDITPEKLGLGLAAQGGRRLIASAEGTIFEIAKGRYSKSPNFDVFSKAHSGDPLRVQRVRRPDVIVEQPSLTMALAVQPNVLQGLAGQTSMAERGFLARFVFAVPPSMLAPR